MLRVEKTETGYALEGVIDENSDFSAIPDEPADIDLGRVSRINSMGILRWRDWGHGQASAKTLHNVPVSFVTAMSCVADMAKGVAVGSVRAPFVDPQTGDTEELSLGSDVLRKIKAERACPAVKSPTSGREMTLDEDVEFYFAFLFHDNGPALAPN